jgi:hypothetical protein
VPAPKKYPEIKRTTARCCYGGYHVKACRPARPLCREMRKAQAAKYAPCDCGRVHFPHRRSYCQRGGADRFGFGFGAEQPPETGVTEAQQLAAIDEFLADAEVAKAS